MEYIHPAFKLILSCLKSISNLAILSIKLLRVETPPKTVRHRGGFGAAHDGYYGEKMQLFRCFIVGLAMCLLQSVFAFAEGVDGKTQAEYKEVQWHELVPESWNPAKIFEGIDINQYQDDDPRLAELMVKFEKEWQNAPTNPQLDGLLIKIPGYIAPLDWAENGLLNEFLLVPYFGACLHVPPPPANQIIYIKMDKPLKGFNSMDTIWVYGELKIMKNDSGSMGVSGYSMRADKIEKHQYQPGNL